MNAFQVCDSLILQVKNSNLNFTLQESPFSLTMSIKKSFIRNKTGDIITGSIKNTFENSNLQIDSKLRVENNNLKDEIKTLKSDIKDYKDTTYDLSEKLEKSKVEISELLFQIKETKEAKETLNKVKLEAKTLKIALDKEVEIKKSLTNNVNSLEKDALNSTNEINSAKKIMKSKDKELYCVQKKNDNLEETVQRLRTEIGSLKSDKLKIQKELKNLKRKAEKEDKKQGLSKCSSNSQLLLQTSVANSNELQTTLSTITTNSNMLSLPNLIQPWTPTIATQSPSYTPPGSPARVPEPLKPQPIEVSVKTGNCSHSPQCVARQPKPPPPSKCSILIHHGSKYHEHVASGPHGLPAKYGGHDKCMEIEYRNYGCSDCVWFKHWGQLHGLPDLYPWKYQPSGVYKSQED